MSAIDFDEIYANNHRWIFGKINNLYQLSYWWSWKSENYSSDTSLIPGSNIHILPYLIDFETDMSTNDLTQARPCISTRLLAILTCWQSPHPLPLFSRNTGKVTIATIQKKRYLHKRIKILYSMIGTIVVCVCLFYIQEMYYYPSANSMRYE